MPSYVRLWKQRYRYSTRYTEPCWTSFRMAVGRRRKAIAVHKICLKPTTSIIEKKPLGASGGGKEAVHKDHTGEHSRRNSPTFLVHLRTNFRRRIYGKRLKIFHTDGHESHETQVTTAWQTSCFRSYKLCGSRV